MATGGGHHTEAERCVELITLAVMAALLGYVSEARWLRYAFRAELMHRLFPYLPSKSGLQYPTTSRIPDPGQTCDPGAGSRDQPLER